MSTWTCNPRLRAALAALCAAAGLGLSAGLAEDADRGRTTQPVAGGAVVVAGPPGYCVDPVATRVRPTDGFVLLGACAALSDNGPAPAYSAALTAAISPGGEAPTVADTAEVLAQFLATTAGRALLSRSATADTVEVLDSRIEGGVLYLHLRDTSPFDGAEVASDYWRAILDFGAHAVSLSVLPLADRPLQESAARGLLDGFITATRDATAAVPGRTPPKMRPQPFRTYPRPEPRPEAGRAPVTPPPRPAGPPGRRRPCADSRRCRSRPPAPARSPGD